MHSYVSFPRPRPRPPGGTPGSAALAVPTRRRAAPPPLPRRSPSSGHLRPARRVSAAGGGGVGWTTPPSGEVGPPVGVLLGTLRTGWTPPRGSGPLLGAGGASGSGRAPPIAVAAELGAPRGGHADRAAPGSPVDHDVDASPRSAAICGLLPALKAPSSPFLARARSAHSPKPPVKPDLKGVDRCRFWSA